MSSGSSSTGGFTLFRRYFWKPPRAHGEVIEDRSVSFLELFYDLVYVVVIARAAHTLAEHVSWRGVADFAVVFGLIWIAWLNGTMYHDLHGRQDGRTRTFVFIQMALLALLAVFTSEATGRRRHAVRSHLCGIPPRPDLALVLRPPSRLGRVLQHYRVVPGWNDRVHRCDRRKRFPAE